jgi:uncharacterized protein
MIKTVIDTNVIVSAFLNESGAPAKILEMIYRKDIKVAVDERVLEEYARVLGYSRFGLNKHDVDLLLFFMRNNAEFSGKCQALPDVKLPEDDRIFMEVAINTKTQFLITGNFRHFNFSEYGGCRIVNPAEFIKLHP